MVHIPLHQFNFPFIRQAFILMLQLMLQLLRLEKSEGTGGLRAVTEVKRLGGHAVLLCVPCSRTPQLQRWNFILSEIFVVFPTSEAK